MGQTQCCEAATTPTHLLNPALALKFIDVQEDPTQSPESQPIYLTSRSTNRKQLGDAEEGGFTDSKPALSSDLKDRIKTLQPIQLQCYRRLKNDRGVAEMNAFYRFNRTGIVYEGEWLNSKPHGYGKNYYPNGGYYEGTFFNGLPHGFGRFINANGDYYQGEVRFGRGNGEGRYCAGEVTFHGLFRDNVLHGEGEERGGDYYFKGDYEYGCKKQGILKYGGNIYEGGFENDNFHGNGTLATPEGKYAGGFLNGLQHGYGEFHWTNGSKYRGNYRRGLKDGDGEFFNAGNNTICRGIWSRGQLQGDGEYVQPRGTLNRVIWQESRISALK